MHNACCLHSGAFCSLPAEQRSISLSDIGARTQLDVDGAEFLLMKALSLKLIHGQIDQVDQRVQVWPEQKGKVMAWTLTAYTYLVSPRSNVVSGRAASLLWPASLMEALLVAAYLRLACIVAAGSARQPVFQPVDVQLCAGDVGAAASADDATGQRAWRATRCLGHQGASGPRLDGGCWRRALMALKFLHGFEV